MKKSTAVKMFGGPSKLAALMRVSRQTITVWPEVLTSRQTDEVIGVAVRTGIPTAEIRLALAEPAIPYVSGRKPKPPGQGSFDQTAC